ncbi:MAG: class I SAM-dependent methyltransferase [Planctomycetia bacterium]
MTYDQARKQYDEAAADYDRRWSRYVDGSLTAVAARLPLHTNRLLDVPCGPAGLHTRMKQDRRPAEYVGVDASAAMLRQALPDLNLIQGDAARLPFADETFDVVVSASGLHYVDDPTVWLTEFHRVTKPGGRLLLVDWHGDAWPLVLLGWWIHRKSPAVRRIHRPAAVAAALRTVGYNVLETSSIRIDWFWRLFLIEAERTAEVGS